MEDPEKTIEAFVDALTGDAHKRWLVKADLVLSFYFKQREIAYTAEDVISEIIKKTIDEGGRNWDMNKVPLDAYMMKTIESFVSNISRKELNFEPVDFNDLEDNERTKKIYNSHYTTLDEIEKERDFEELMDECLEVLAEDTEAGLVLLEMRQGKTEQEIEQTLGIDHKRLLAVKQKIRRTLRKNIHN